MPEFDEWEERWARYGFLEMVADMKEVFASQRAMEMFAWMVAFGATGGHDHAEMVRRLVAAGFSKSPVYAASADIKKFQSHLKQKWNGKEPTRQQLIKKVMLMGSQYQENPV